MVVVMASGNRVAETISARSPANSLKMAATLSRSLLSESGISQRRQSGSAMEQAFDCVSMRVLQHEVRREQILWIISHELAPIHRQDARVALERSGG
jgi:hypothetical protein